MQVLCRCKASGATGLIAGVLILDFSHLSLAQAPPQQQEQRQQTSVSEVELKTFAKAYVQYHKIRQEYEPRLKNTQDPEKSKQIQQEANSKVEAALAKQGLTPEAYSRILKVVNADDELRKKALRLIEEERKKP
jgi:hypothetical protein